MSVEHLYVSHPERWWIASRDDLPWLADPDEQESNVRHADRGSRDWLSIAGVVEVVGRALAAGDRSLDAGMNVAMPSDTTDAGIVRSWFKPGEWPWADAWDTGLTNGRHRLWNVWLACPEALLPIRSTLLDAVDDIPDMGEGFGESVRSEARAGMQKLRHTHIPQRSPRYVASLKRIAA